MNISTHSMALIAALLALSACSPQDACVLNRPPAHLMRLPVQGDMQDRMEQLLNPTETMPLIVSD